ncbi:hypothetical protein TCAL_17039 [Tigriopus californicus]|uniref:Uncharacterized protein n=1 Tax=Tigriopus californicus TaxID=6832 RepID=A0A553PQG1_TIGCA|nr:hypothetical protein TCAL_17039 [Tigriopus californicus]
MSLTLSLALIRKKSVLRHAKSLNYQGKPLDRGGSYYSHGSGGRGSSGYYGGGGGGGSGYIGGGNVTYPVHFKSSKTGRLLTLIMKSQSLRKLMQKLRNDGSVKPKVSTKTKPKIPKGNGASRTKKGLSQRKTAEQSCPILPKEDLERLYQIKEDRLKQRQRPLTGASTSTLIISAGSPDLLVWNGHLPIQDFEGVVSQKDDASKQEIPTIVHMQRPLAANTHFNNRSHSKDHPSL